MSRRLLPPSLANEGHASLTPVSTSDRASRSLMARLVRRDLRALKQVAERAIAVRIGEAPPFVDLRSHVAEIEGDRVALGRPEGTVALTLSLVGRSHP